MTRRFYLPRAARLDGFFGSEEIASSREVDPRLGMARTLTRKHRHLQRQANFDNQAGAHAVMTMVL